MSASPTTRAPERLPAPDSRFDLRLAEILDYATEIFADKGYEGASMRDLSRLSGISLAGLYYYFDSKERLLYFIQHHTFTTIIERVRERLAGSSDPEERIRIFVRNHIDYALARQKAMKVLSHEDDVLKHGYGSELAAIKREYYRICVGLVEELAEAEGRDATEKGATAAGRVGTRTAVMGLFGMMNWLYTWYNPRVDPDAETLTREISDIFLYGVRGGKLSHSAPANRNARSGQTVKLGTKVGSAPEQPVPGPKGKPAVKASPKTGRNSRSE
ncbi:MAG: TetR/AcrR family transcriptional regulator [Acidobacteriota bacterium]|nr:TetR/AcrR family transcriptional regulator [Acidobacteriota bacterium]